MIHHHTKASERITFARSYRQVFGEHWPARRFKLRRGRSEFDPERNVVGPAVIVCAVLFFILVWSGAA
jgi:hypothetical protein